MKNVQAFLKSVRERAVKTSKRRGNPVVKRKDLSKLKHEFMDALVADFREVLKESELAGENENGVVIAIENESVDEIAFEINPKVKNLNFEPYVSIEQFKEEQRLKEEKRKQRKRDRKASYNNTKAKKKKAE